MNFQQNEKCVVFPERKIKTIIDHEFICDIQLYYMSDFTAYPEDKVCKVEDVENSIINLDDNIIKELLIDRFGRPAEFETH